MSSHPSGFVRTPRLAPIQESATLRLNALVQEMKKQGKVIHNLTAGESDFPVPPVVQKAMIEAVEKGMNKYTPVAGIPELRSAVAAYTNAQQKKNSTAWESKNVVVSNGGKQACFNSVMSLLSRGDEAIVVAPYWLSYPEMIKIAEATPVVVNPGWENHFKLTPDLLEKTLRKHPAIKLLILNSPSNPTGVTYSSKEFKALGEVLLKKEFNKVWVMSDEIYDSIVFDQNSFVSFLDAVPEMQSRTVTVNGLSKSGAITGWRLGWSVAPLELTESNSALQGQCTSGANAPTQWAAVAALKMPQEILAERRKRYEARRDLCLEILGKSKKIRAVRPEGAFYIFFQVEGSADGTQLAEKLLKNGSVAVVPGEPFGSPEFVRMSFATDEETLKKACEAIVATV